MATKPETPTKLADIIKYRRAQGGGVASSLAGGIKEKLKEKFDPRQIFDQQGILTALFPGLKAFKATTGPKQQLKDKIAPSISFEEIIPVLEKINANNRIISKNMMVLPMMHRDINVMRQNIAKLVKLKGASASTKADMYFMKAKEREALYEEQFKKVPTRITPTTTTESGEKEDGGVFASLLSFAGSIVSALASLGKVILSAFATLAEIVKSLLLQLGQAIFRVVITTIGTFIVKSISDFFKNLGLSALIWRLIKFALRPILWPLAIAAAAYVAGEYLKENPWDFIDESNLSLATETLPLPQMKAGDELAKVEGFDPIRVSKDVAERKGKPHTTDFSKVTEKDTVFTKSTLEDLQSGKKKNYELWFPGLIQRASIPLSDSEAQDLGKKYSALMAMTKARKLESEKKEPNVEKISNADTMIKELTLSIRRIFRDSYVKTRKPELLQNQDVKSFIDMMDRKIKYPEMGPIESRIAKKVDDSFENIKNLNFDDFTPNFREAEGHLKTELGKIKIDPNEFTPKLEAPKEGTGSGQQINQKTGEVKSEKQGALMGESDTKVSSLSSNRGTSSVIHIPEEASPWNIDLIGNIVTGQRALIG